MAPSKPSSKAIPTDYASRKARAKYSINKPDPSSNSTLRSWNFMRSPKSGKDRKPLTTAEKYAQLHKKSQNEKTRIGVRTNGAFLKSLKMEIELEPSLQDAEEASGGGSALQDDTDGDGDAEMSTLPVKETGKKKRSEASKKARKQSKKKGSNRKLSATGVLFRTTKRTQQQRAVWGATSIVLPNVRGSKGRHAKKQPVKQSRIAITDLPESVRERIWRYIVVDSSQWIDVGSEAGREQPDLAMVNRQIREECLPMYYKENTFGVTLGGTSGASNNLQNQGGKSPQGIQALNKWATTLSKKKNEDGKWFGFIERWCFVYRGGGPLYEGFEYEEDDFVFAVEAFNQFSIHSRVDCILPGHENYGFCHLTDLSNCGNLNQAILRGLGEDGRIASAKVLSKLAGALLGIRQELALAKCRLVEPQRRSSGDNSQNNSKSLDWFLSRNFH